MLYYIRPEFNADLRITIIAKRGDPDLLVSSVYANPHCSRYPGGEWGCVGGNMWVGMCGCLEIDEEEEKEEDLKVTGM